MDQRRLARRHQRREQRMRQAEIRHLAQRPRRLSGAAAGRPPAEAAEAKEAHPRLLPVINVETLRRTLSRYNGALKEFIHGIATSRRTQAKANQATPPGQVRRPDPARPDAPVS